VQPLLLFRTETSAHSEFGRGRDVDDREHAARIAVRDLDEAGERAAGRRRVQDQVHRSAGRRHDPLDHSVPVGGHRRAERAQAPGVGVAGGGEDPGASDQADLYRGESDRRPRAVDQQRAVRGDAEAREAPVSRLHRHRQCGRLDEIESFRNASPVVHDREIRRASAVTSGVVGRTQDHVTEGRIGDALAERVDGSRHFETDAARELAGEQSAAQGPVGRVQAARVHGHANLAGPRARHTDLLHPQHVGCLALTEALATALRDRGVPEPTAALAAQVGMAVFSHVGVVWFHHPDRNLDKLLCETFEDLRVLATP
jgi:hypothetical protein